jgi:acyloxyacyl hydrolase
MVSKALRLDAKAQEGGGAKCVGCVLVVALIEQLTYVHSQSVDKTMEMLCSYLPSTLSVWCADLIQQYGSTVINMLENEETPDLVCLQLGICNNATCHLFPYPSKMTPFMKAFPSFTAYEMPQPSRLHERQARAGFDPLQWLWDKLSTIVNSHLPLVDLDGDKFSSADTFRGSRWRGRDCNEFANDIYPGRQVNDYDASTDHNCNGIRGTNPSTGRSYESELCAGTDPHGVVILGDSAAAHFHVPPEYIMASQINSSTYRNLVDILLEEFDWPQMSATTGYEDTQWIGTPPGPVHSFYLKMRERNRCVHRDYQNIAVNGARSGSMSNPDKGIIHTLARNATHDSPVFLTLALIGNDVCNGHHDFNSMTTPQEMLDNTLTSLRYLDNGVLPKGSHVFLVGLADGTLLYNYLHNRTHPLGALRNDITYAQFYDFMNCAHASPCWGWMNTDASVREKTQQRADELSAVLRNITLTQKFNNFDMYYFGSPINEVIKIWTAQGGQVYELIEPVDGFHPSQIGNALVADYMWKQIEANYPHIMPPINPNNDQIDKLFGDQGGY